MSRAKLQYAMERDLFERAEAAFGAEQRSSSSSGSSGSGRRRGSAASAAAAAASANRRPSASSSSTKKKQQQQGGGRRRGRSGARPGAADSDAEGSSEESDSDSFSGGSSSASSSSSDGFSEDADGGSSEEDDGFAGAQQPLPAGLSSDDDDDDGDEEADFSSSSGEDGDGAAAAAGQRLTGWVEMEKAKERARHRRRNRVLVVSSRGVGARFRHLMNDVVTLLPHAKKDSKVHLRKNLHELNEIAEVNSCEKTLFFQMKGKRDMYLWASRCPQGPSCLFQVMNVHTMAELKLTGNSLLGSRPILFFDSAFDDPARPHMGAIKELFEDIWATPPGHPRSKPFIDHIICFFFQDEHIWFRNYQIIENVEGTKAGEKNSAATTQLAEIGPRFVLEPVRLFTGSFGGPTAWRNDSYLTPAAMRRAARAQAAGTYKNRFENQRRAQHDAATRHVGYQQPQDEFAHTFTRGAGAGAAGGR